MRGTKAVQVFYNTIYITYFSISGELLFDDKLKQKCLRDFNNQNDSQYLNYFFIKTVNGFFYTYIGNVCSKLYISP